MLNYNIDYNVYIYIYIYILFIHYILKHAGLSAEGSVKMPAPQ